ncbi:MAG: EAL domain-containing protein [Methylococcaceae bacterium]|nr:EAL domain-containing protein [Methylococcaceae bacterium]
MTKQRISKYELQAQLNLKLFESLGASERKYRDLVNNLRQIVFQLDLEGHFVFLNAAWEVITGVSIDSALKQSWLGFVDLTDRALAAEKLQQIYAQNYQADKHFECRLLVNQSTLISVEVFFTPLFGVDGIEGIIGTFFDVTEHKNTLKELNANKERLAFALQGADDGYWDWNLETDEVYYSVGWKSMLGYTDKDALSDTLETWNALVDPNDRESVLRSVNSYLAGELDKFNIEFRMLHKQGGWIDILSRASLARDEQGKVLSPKRLVGTHVDITERKKAQLQLKMQNIALETTANAIIITDAQAKIEWANSAFSVLTGYTLDELIGLTPKELVYSEAQNSAFYKDLWAAIKGGKVWTGDLINKKKCGALYYEHMTISPVFDDYGYILHFIAVKEDITRRKESEQQIEQLAFYDALTGIPNRRLFLDKLEQCFVRSRREQQYSALLFIDLDRFKLLNDTHGHDIGDLLLIEVAGRINSCVSEKDLVARLGGDEFVVMLEQLAPNSENALAATLHVAEKILVRLNKEYRFDSIKHRGSSSIGICLFMDEYESIEGILKHADIAMYEAKSAGRNVLRVFDPLMQQAIKEAAALEEALWRALEEKEFTLFYQLLINHDRKIIGAEALIRWQHPEKGVIGPDDFLPLIESNGMIIPVGDWVINEGLAQLKKWQQSAMLNDISLSINISRVQFGKSDFVSKLLQAVEYHQVDCNFLYLELTESIFIDNPDSLINKIAELRSKGIRFSMDDFGTGYSSLSYLKRFKFDQLKIDRLFVQDIENNPEDLVLVTTMIKMGQNLGLEVVSEGIENQENFETLIKLGCEKFQGYWINRPMPVSEINALSQLEPMRRHILQ